MNRNGLKLLIIPAMCLGLSVLVRNGTQAKEHWSEEQIKLYPVLLKCPADNHQVLELVSQNRLRDSRYIRVRYVDGIAAVVTVDAFLNDRQRMVTFVKDIDIRAVPDPTNKNAKAFKEYAIAAANEANSFNAICVGPPEKRTEALTKLKANRRLLGLE